MEQGRTQDASAWHLWKGLSQQNEPSVKPRQGPQPSVLWTGLHSMVRLYCGAAIMEPPTGMATVPVDWETTLYPCGQSSPDFR